MTRPGTHDPEPDRPEPLPPSEAPDAPVTDPPPTPSPTPPMTAHSDFALLTLMRARRVGLIH